MSRRALPLAVAAVVSTTAARLGAQPLDLQKIEQLPAVTDAAAARVMEERHVPGAAIAIVHDGRVVVLRGYGMADLETGRPVDPSRTIFRVGSVSKLLTAVAAVQLADAGSLDLRRDIRELVTEFPIRYATTTHQLLTHTAAFGERFAGTFTLSPASVVPLADHLHRMRPDQFLEPGRAYSYSSYNTAIAGLVIEKVSKQRYEQYMAERLFTPIGMRASSAFQPPPNAADIARGYEWTGGRQQPLPFRYSLTGPAGGITTTASDMSRLMIALLGDGTVDGSRLLSPRAARMMVAPQYTADRRIPAATYGAMHWFTRGRDLVFKDGTLGDHIGAVVLDPAERLGVFVASNTNPGIEWVLDPILDHLYGRGPAVERLSPPAGSGGRSSRLAGAFRDYEHTRDDMSRLVALMPMIQSQVVSEPDGAIQWRGQRWIEIEPLVFRSETQRDVIVFRDDGRGGLQLHEWNGTFERIGWPEQRWFHLSFAALCAIAFLLYPVHAARVWRSGTAHRDRSTAQLCGTFVAVLNLIFMAGLAFSLKGLGSSVPLPWTTIVLLSIPLVTLAVTAASLPLTAGAWWKGWWSRTERAMFSALVLTSSAFLVFLNYWRLLGFGV